MRELPPANLREVDAVRTRSRPTFRLSFPDGTSNEYRLRQNQIEFLTSDGTWRILSDEDVQAK